MERFKTIRKKLNEGDKVSDGDFQFAMLYMLYRMNKSIEKMGASSGLAAMSNIVSAFKPKEQQP